MIYSLLVTNRFMQISNKDFKKLKQLEESLWMSETRFNKQYMNSILSSGFVEFGHSGRTYKRKEILSTTFLKINIKFPLKNFKIHYIVKNVALITYISKVQYSKFEISNRSSLWLKTPFGWKLQFHQGTPAS